MMQHQQRSPNERLQHPEPFQSGGLLNSKMTRLCTHVIART